jgi:hypothetical protein
MSDNYMFLVKSKYDIKEQPGDFGQKRFMREKNHEVEIFK